MAIQESSPFAIENLLAQIADGGGGGGGGEGGGGGSSAKNTVKYYYGDFDSENGNITSASYWTTPEMNEEDEVSWEYILNDYKTNGVLPIIMIQIGEDYSLPYIMTVHVPDNPEEEPSGMKISYLAASTSNEAGLIHHTYFLLYDSDFELLTNASSVAIHTADVTWTSEGGE